MLQEVSRDARALADAPEELKGDSLIKACHNGCHTVSESNSLGVALRPWLERGKAPEL